MVYSNGDVSGKTVILKTALDKTEAIIIGARVGLFDTAGLAYGNGDTFNAMFPGYYDRYGLQSINEADFYQFLTLEESIGLIQVLEGYSAVIMITRIFILLGLIYQICFSFQREMDNLRYYYNIKDNCPENIKSVYCNYGYLSFCTGQTGAKLDGDI